MSLSLNRHYQRANFVRRNHDWEQREGRRWRERGPEYDPIIPVRHFLKNTARPCSCAICKRPRYQRDHKSERVALD